jgi:hypothetical protein
MRRATGFIEHSLDGWLEKNLELSSREVEYAQYFKNRFSFGQISKVKVLLITDGMMSERIKTIESETIEKVRYSFEIWDQRRILDADIPDRGSEDIHVDFTKWLPQGLPCLIASSSKQDSSTTILAVIPATILVAVFEEFGSLLLESNVRTFLSARGAVNKGIQATLAHEPSKFLSYNNGLTTTATNVKFGIGSNSSNITSIDKWQIVNGGQTTASIAHFMRGDKSRNVDDVFIQMKLVIVNERDASTVVQSVAKYANSQNRVSAADLFANHEFHVRMEQISRKLRAPALEGKQYQSGWFYERARGQWENDKVSKGTPAEQKKFELEYPRTQKVTKTDWAKFAFCWEEKPHIVSKGAQSVFADFANEIDKQWEKDDLVFNDGYFRNGVSLAIIYEDLRQAVMQSDWYKASPGYLANIVAYAISRFAKAVKEEYSGLSLDFGKIWQRQRTSESLRRELLKFAKAAQSHLTNEARPQANVTQWAKQQACWDGFSKVKFGLDASIQSDLIGQVEAREEAVEQTKLRKLDSEVEAVTRIISVPPSIWQQVRSSDHNVAISPMERDLISLFAQTNKVPSDKQARALLRMLERFVDAGVIRSSSY